MIDVLIILGLTSCVLLPIAIGEGWIRNLYEYVNSSFTFGERRFYKVLSVDDWNKSFTIRADGANLVINWGKYNRDTLRRIGKMVEENPHKDIYIYACIRKDTLTMVGKVKGFNITKKGEFDE